MKSFVTDDFLLHSEIARELYHDHAAKQPIFDYHCHLPPDQIAGNHAFANLTEIWLAGDHYKWRAMRAHGVPENYCTGNASDWEKFLAYARTVPATLRNPLYHWTHLELKRFFGISKLLDESTAKEIWDAANQKLPKMPVHAILESNHVAVVCTTDDPTDSLEHHRVMKPKTRVYPTWRPDKALAIDQPTSWNAWVDKLGDCGNLSAFLAVLDRRLGFFHANGCRLSDHGLLHCFADECTESEAARMFDEARAGRPVDADKLRSFLMHWLGEQYHERGWVMQLHLGALRNVNTRQLRALGVDTGFDCISDVPQIAALAQFLDALGDRLPKTILYNLNPAENHAFAALAGSLPGKVQWGPAWWFLDQKDGMESQLNTLSNLSLLSRFIGMTTDSRSFLSYSRHEYFRRLLCDLIARDVKNGELPRDMKLLGKLVRDVCFDNAKNYFPLA